LVLSGSNPRRTCGSFTINRSGPLADASVVVKRASLRLMKSLYLAYRDRPKSRGRQLRTDPTIN
jgi:hypothetical protein